MLVDCGRAPDAVTRSSAAKTMLSITIVVRNSYNVSSEYLDSGTLPAQISSCPCMHWRSRYIRLGVYKEVGSF